MPRYKLTLEYDGTGFVGWQRQANGPSIQGQLEAACERLTGAAIAVTAAGRTDAGVHARGQVVHLDLAAPWEPFRLMQAISFHLRPDPITVVACDAVPDSFNARFDAIERRYRYRILNRRPVPVLDRDRVWHVSRPIDAAAMAEGAQALIGKHDFSSFRAIECQAKSPVRTLTTLTVTREGEEISIEAVAPSFLHHQVRNIVGTLAQVGLGRWPVDRVAEVLAARDRSQAGPTAPAAGLTFWAVRYPSADTR